MSIEPAPYPTLDGAQPCLDDPEAFFPQGQGSGRTTRETRQSRHAIALCGTCPFIRPCAAYALTHLVAGIWGGTTEQQRRTLRRKHRIQAQRLTYDRGSSA